VIAANTAHREDLPGSQRGAGGRKSGEIAGLLSCRVAPIQSGTASCARQGLGMEAAIERICIFRPALQAKIKTRQRGVAPVVRQLADDRVPRAALRTVDERVAMPPCRRLFELCEAFVTRGEIQWNGY
jgi:hypothetical protein